MMSFPWNLKCIELAPHGMKTDVQMSLHLLQTVHPSILYAELHCPLWLKACFTWVGSAWSFAVSVTTPNRDVTGVHLYIHAARREVEPLQVSCSLENHYLRIENAEGNVLIAVYLCIYLFICMRVIRVTKKVVNRIA